MGKIVKKSKAKPVTIIMINWNSYEFNKACISSVMKNTAYIDFEILLIDNGSSDGSLEKLENEFPFVQTIKNKENKGFAYAVNQGYRAAKGDYLVYLSSDALVLDGWLGEAIKVFESSQKIAVVGAREVTKAQADSPAELEKIRNEKNIEKLTLPVLWLTSKEMVKKIGYLDAEFFSPAYGEESDWNFRAHNLGYRIVRANKCNVVHFGSAIIRKEFGIKKYIVLINYHRLRSMFFNLSLPDLARFVPGLGLIFARSFFDGTLREVLLSYWLNLKDWKMILEQRKKKRTFIPFKEPVFTRVNY